jgi:hypothetical protein
MEVVGVGRVISWLAEDEVGMVGWAMDGTWKVGWLRLAQSATERHWQEKEFVKAPPLPSLPCWAGQASEARQEGTRPPPCRTLFCRRLSSELPPRDPPAPYGWRRARSATFEIARLPTGHTYPYTGFQCFNTTIECTSIAPFPKLMVWTGCCISMQPADPDNSGSRLRDRTLHV